MHFTETEDDKNQLELWGLLYNIYNHYNHQTQLYIIKNSLLLLSNWPLTINPVLHQPTNKTKKCLC